FGDAGTAGDEEAQLDRFRRRGEFRGHGERHATPPQNRSSKAGKSRPCAAARPLVRNVRIARVSVMVLQRIRAPDSPLDSGSRLPCPNRTRASLVRRRHEYNVVRMAVFPAPATAGGENRRISSTYTIV